MTDETQNDTALIKAYLEGDVRSFDLLYERYRKPLYSYLNKLCSGNGMNADDVFQQTWIRAIEKLDLYRDQEKFSAWLMRIAHNLSIDRYRENTRRAEDVFDDSLEEVLPAQRSTVPGYDLENAELGNALKTALKELSPELREVFLLRQEDMAFKDIAKVQKCSINTCLARMQYALKRLRVNLASFVREKGE